MASTGRRVGVVAAILGIAVVAFAAGVLLSRASEPSAADVAEAYAAALEHQDVTAMVALYADRPVYDDPGIGSHFTTRAQLRDFYWCLFIPSVRFRVSSIDAGPDSATVQWRWTGLRVWSDGEPYAISGVSVLEVSDGLITRQVVSYDPSAFA